MTMLACLLLPFTVNAAEPPIEKLKLPPGFKAEVYAYPVPNARQLAHGPNGVVFVGNSGGDSVYALVPNSKTKKPDVVKIGSGLSSPHGVAFRGRDLYVGEIPRVVVYRNIIKDFKKPPKPEQFGPPFPDKSHHGMKTINFGPDGWLYIPVGAPCNICDDDPSMFAAMHKISPDGKNRELVAQGIRNTVGFDWEPATKTLWFTDNGRDWLGDDIPPDELNKVTKPKEHFGFPYCHGGTIKDPKFDSKDCSEFTPPQHNFSAHVASLGMRFIRHAKSPLLKNSILVAQHGSWNRSTPSGYQIVRVQLENGKPTKEEPFITGFLEGKSAWGRPVDILEGEDGSLFISDDSAGAVYKITYTEKKD